MGALFSTEPRWGKVGDKDGGDIPWNGWGIANDSDFKGMFGGTFGFIETGWIRGSLL